MNRRCLDPEDFAREMDALIQDARRWRTLAMNAHELRSRLTWDNTIENFLNIVRETVD